MQIEYEATFTNIDKVEMRKRLKKGGAVLVRPEFLQKRLTFHLPEGHRIKGGWLRVRDEGDKITLSLKIVDGDKITDQKETCLTVDSFNEAVSLLETIGCKRKGYHETKRELWKMGETEITIDEWPFLEPFVEVEGKSEAEVKAVSEKIGFDYGSALFCSIDTLYAKKYGFPESYFNNETLLIVFGEVNPFVK